MNDAIAAGDTEAAGEGMAAHYRDTGNLLLRWLDSLDFCAEPGKARDGRLAG